MKNNKLFSFCLFLGFLLLVTSCSPDNTPTATVIPEELEPDLYLNIIWHQHQPFYAVDSETGLVSAPWVRFHATKDYVDMVEILDNYPGIHVTFNLTPSLLKQITSFNSGQRDIIWEMTLVPASELTGGQKAYILQRFFDTNTKIIEKYPRYKELQGMRGGTSQTQIENAISSWTDQDFLDLQVLFNIAWTDSSFLIGDPYATLVSKERGYSEEDKNTILQLHAEIMSQVIPIHKQYQDNGQIEITFTPYAHPILPLLIDTNLATIAVPDISLPSSRFSYENDARQQLIRGTELYQEYFGRMPLGMWPAEGSVAEEMVAMTAQAGVKWMVTDEGILSNSLNIDFNRDLSGVPSNATTLYQPYTVESEGSTLTVFFRDTALSNKVSFDYSQLPAEEAVSDFMSRVRAIRDVLKDDPGSPYILTVILDGENAWESYANDGKDFLNALYTELSNDPSIQTVTSSEYLQLTDQTFQSIPDLWAGSWDSATFQTWIGEEEENRAWDYLANTRNTLEEYITGSLAGTIPDDQIAVAYDSMLAAEGSDWFWWYGTDKDSGNDSAFDIGYREILGQVFDALGLARPDYLSVPIILPTPIEPDITQQGLFTPILDGKVTDPSEWQNAGSVGLDGTLTNLEYGFDSQHIYFNFIGALTEDFSLYMNIPGTSSGNPFSDELQVLGLYATHKLNFRSLGSPAFSLDSWDGTSWMPVESDEFAFAIGAENLETVSHFGLFPKAIYCHTRHQLSLLSQTLE
jgi:alpha-amylase/alpha-mannosidase (GH57 family)